MDKREDTSWEMTKENKRRQTEEQRAWLQQHCALAASDPREAAIFSGHVCEFCGEPVLPLGIDTVTTGWGEPKPHVRYPDRCGCAEEKEAIGEQTRLAAIAESRTRQEVWASRLERAGVPELYRAATFAAFEERESWPRAAEVKACAKAYMDAFLAGELGPRPWLILHGGYGLGKTHLAVACIIRGLLERKLCHFAPWAEFLRRRQESWEDDAVREGDIMAEVREAELLAIDDLDKRRATAWTREGVWEVLNWRHERCLATILTFNWGPEDVDPDAPGRSALEAFLGRAVVDRLLQSTWKVVEFQGPSYRSDIEWGPQQGGEDGEEAG